MPENHRMYTKQDLMNLPLERLRDIASALKLEGRGNASKGKLVNLIYNRK
jgi:hypothetical protein